MDNKVILYIYDISNGMAATFGQMVIGKHIEAIYHSSIVVFGKEFYFSGGICYDPPGTTAFGQSIKKIEMGTTEVTVEDLFEYLKAIQDKYNFNSYHVFENNCNHFTNEICEFLTGNPIPDYILNQAKEYQNTPIGQLIGGMQVNLNNNNNNYNISYDAFMNQKPGNTNIQQSQNTIKEKIKDIRDIMQFMEVIQDNKKVIIDFYANWCGPCKRIKPIFGSLAEQYKDSILFCEVNVDVSQDLVANIGVNAMPTFILYENGKEFERIQGANETKVKEALGRLNKS